MKEINITSNVEVSFKLWFSSCCPSSSSKATNIEELLSVFTIFIHIHTHACIHIYTYMYIYIHYYITLLCVLISHEYIIPIYHCAMFYSTLFLIFVYFEIHNPIYFITLNLSIVSHSTNMQYFIYLSTYR